MSGVSVSMTKPIVFRRSGKVEGIKGLYKSPTSGRFYVRYSYHGIDKQATILPTKCTFSELERCARTALTKLAKEVKTEFIKILNAKTIVQLDVVEVGRIKLQKLIEKDWSARGVSENHIKRLLRLSEHFSLCFENRKAEIKRIDDHNIEALRGELNNANTQYMKHSIYDCVNTVFKHAISTNCHYGHNPCCYVSKPKFCPMHRQDEMTFDIIRDVYNSLIEDAKGNNTYFEYALFFRLCVETGQRPSDVFRFDVQKLDGNHYQFWSQKTMRTHRVLHKLSKPVISMIGELFVRRGGISLYSHTNKNSFCNDEEFNSIWRNSLTTYTAFLTERIKKFSKGKATLYHTRHFFITEIFSMTESEFWAGVFTHEGKDTNQKNYLHIKQEKADEIMGAYTEEIERCLTGEKIE